MISRAHPSVVWVALLLLLAESLAFVHAGCAEHRFCHEHGVFEEVHEREHPANARDARHHGAHDAGEAGSRAVPGERTADTHVACVVLAKRADTGRTDAAPITARALVRSDTLIGHAGDRVLTIARRYLLAPKHSPPAS